MPIPAPAAQTLSPRFTGPAQTYFEQIRALESSAGLPSRDQNRAYDQARQIATAAQTSDADRGLMSLLRRYSILVIHWRAMVADAGKTDFVLSPERAQQHAACRHEIDRSLTTGVLFANPKCSASAVR